MRITLIDCGAANVPSVERALGHLGAATERATTPEQVAAASVLVLPGTGHFGGMMHAFEVLQLTEAIRGALVHQLPFLGINVGMHLLFEQSEEAPGLTGFGVFPGEVEELPLHVRLPHLGWNQLQHIRPGRLLRGVSEKAWFYFAHGLAAPASGESPSSGRVVEMRPSNAPPVEQPAGAFAICHCGRPFVAVAESGKTFGVQFLPEKSGDAGMLVLRNFLEAAR